MYLTPCGPSKGYTGLNSKWANASLIGASGVPAPIPGNASKGFYPSGQKWGGSSSTPRAAGIEPGRTHYLGAFRPNQPMARGMIPGGGTRPTALGCMGDCSHCSKNCLARLGSSIDGSVRRRAIAGLGNGSGYYTANSEYFYQAKRQAGFVWGAGDIASIVSYIQANSPNVIDNSSTTSGDNPTITLYGHCIMDRNQLSDIKGDLDTAIQASGRQLVGSTIALVAAAPAIAPVASASSSGTFDLGTFLTDNWMYLAAGGVGLIVLRNYL